jgi:hypothetical protein
VSPERTGVDPASHMHYRFRIALNRAVKTKLRTYHPHSVAPLCLFEGVVGWGFGSAIMTWAKGGLGFEQGLEKLPGKLLIDMAFY